MVTINIFTDLGGDRLFGLSGSELLFYGGIALMILAAVIAVLCFVIFHVTGSRIKKRLEKEYGRPQHDNT